MATLQTVNLHSIMPNPHRRMETYPLKRRKLDALKQSIEQVGFWEGVIVRPVGNSYECAFGHHRLGAAREQLGEDAEITAIVRDLDDRQMLQFMGRENGEDYNADFLVMLETWQAGEKFLEHARENVQPIDIARLLGWLSIRGPGAKLAGQVEMSPAAIACNAAHKLIEQGHLFRTDLEELSVRDAHAICQTHLARLELVDKKAKHAAKTGKAPTKKQVRSVKRQYSNAARSVAKDVRAGRVPAAHARTEVLARGDQRVIERGLPDFGLVMDRLQKRAKSWHDADFGTQVKAICKVIEQVTDADDRAQYGYLARDLKDVTERCDRSIDRIEKALSPASVSYLKPVSGES